MRKIEGLEYGTHTKGEKLNFAHANGFHPDTYKAFMAKLIEHYPVSAPLLMPFDPHIHHTILTSWNQIADEVATHVRNTNNQGCIGIGHSLGAVSSLIANHRSPGTFKALILLEPVFLPRFIYSFIGPLTNIAMRKKIVPVAKIASKRRDTWDSMEQAHTYLRSKKVFKEIKGDHFDTFINSTLVPTPQGKVTLRYTKDWEAQVYATVANPWPYLKTVNIPTLILRGENTDVIVPKVWKKMKATNTNVEFLQVENTGHLLPLEAPERVANIVIDFINNNIYSDQNIKITPS